MRIITPPASTPVSLQELKAHINYDGTDHDDRLTDLLNDGTKWLEQQTDRAFITQTIEVDLDHVDEKTYLPRMPLASVMSVKYVDTDGTQQTLDPSGYVVVVNDDTRGYVYFKHIDTVPSTDCRPNAWTIRFVAGRADPGGDVRRVLLGFLGQLDFDREFQQQNHAALERAVQSIRSDFLC